MSIFRKLKHPLFLSVHKFFLKFGLQVVPNHYYSPIADIQKLRRSKAVWARKSRMPGIECDLDSQEKNLQEICLPYLGECIGNKTYLNATRIEAGPGFGYLEAQALHAFIRHHKPRKIIEIGSGVSTVCSLEALKRNRDEDNKDFELICVEPYPSEKLCLLKEVHVIKMGVQNLKADFFDLQKNDLLFIDSSHTVKTGSDVNYLILEILPLLRSGVLVHFHDIFFPYDFQRNILTSYFQWAETSLLRAFLIHNSHAKIIFSMSMLHYDRKEVLKEVFPEYAPQKDADGLIYGIYKPFSQIKEHFPASTYLKID